MGKEQRPMGRWAGGQVRRAGMGGAHTGAVRMPRMPRAARRAMAAPTLSDRATFRLRCVEHARRAGVADAVVAVGVSRATVSRWRKRYDPQRLVSLEDRSRRPRTVRKRTVRKRTWTAAQAEAVLALRTRHPRMGKAKLAGLLAARPDAAVPALAVARSASAPP